MDMKVSQQMTPKRDWLPTYEPFNRGVFFSNDYICKVVGIVTIQSLLAL